MTKPPERLFARKDTSGSADHYGSWYILNEYLMPWNEGGAEEYVNADALRADPLAFIDVPDLVWREMPNDFLFAARQPWHFESINGLYQIYWDWGNFEVRMGFQIIRFDSRRSLKYAKAAANTHYRAMLARALKGEK